VLDLVRLDSDLLRAGGWVLACIVGLSVLMWVLILERYWFLYRDLPGLVIAIRKQWLSGGSTDPRVKRRLRDGLTGAFNASLSRWLGTIQVITAVLPLLGLLGTVIGMIKTFEVMTVFGSSNVRGIADGISQALVTTMAGLVTALAGMFFATNLKARIDTETENMSQHLIDESGTRGP